MNRLLRNAAALFAASLLCPTAAFARGTEITPMGLHLAVSAAGLAIAVLLLIEALGLRKIMLGGAIAENLHFVVLAVVCLAASALAKWVSNFVTGITFEQTELVSQLLVLLAMGLFAAYFYSVRKAMQSFMDGMTATLDAAEEAAPSAPDEEPRG